MYAIRWQFASIRKTCKVDDTQVVFKKAAQQRTGILKGVRPDLLRGLEHFVPEIFVRVAFESELICQQLPMLHDLTYSYIHSYILRHVTRKIEVNSKTLEQPRIYPYTHTYSILRPNLTPVCSVRGSCAKPATIAGEWRAARYCASTTSTSGTHTYIHTYIQ